MNELEFTLLDPDRYVPIEQSQEGTRYAPTTPPPGWQCAEQGVWTYWTPPAPAWPAPSGLAQTQPAQTGPAPSGLAQTRLAQGWKVHVSAQLARAQHVLDAVSRVCAAHGVPFKHVATDWIFLWLHHKHGPRTQSGKFCTLYPGGERAARSVMEALSAALPGESGPYVLTDRRFGSSGVVSYRYGAFSKRSRVEPDGSRVPVLTGPDGAEVADDRQPRFVLPPGVADPFAPPPHPAAPGSPQINGYTFTAALQLSNAGGAYRAADAGGRGVFVKEARKDNGYQWDGSTAVERLRREHRTLQLLHAAVPGLCPEPLDYFRHWEHEFLVTELVPGVPLTSWTSQHNPLVKVEPTAAMFLDYYDRCRALLGALREQVRRLHAAGYAFVDLNPRNVLVDAGDNPRLIDFEEAQPLGEPRPVHGAEGFLPPKALRGQADAAWVDQYALAALAQLLLHPLHGVLDRHPAAARHLAAGLPVLPADLWRDAARFRPAATGTSPAAGGTASAAAHTGSAAAGLAAGTVPAGTVPARAALSAVPGGAPSGAVPSGTARSDDAPAASEPELPEPQEVAQAPEYWLGWLAGQVAAGLLAMAEPAAQVPFPFGPMAYATNAHSLAYGTAGVVYALHRAGRPVPSWLLRRLLDLAASGAEELPPGLLVGTAGVAWVLAELGHLDPARELLAAGDRYRLDGRDSTLAHGSAGIALAHLALARRDGDPGHLSRAADLLESIPDGAALVPTLGPDERTGWMAGRPGIALALHYLTLFTGDQVARQRGRALLLADLEQSYQDGSALQFRVSRRDHRVEPYLASGSAGFALVAGRYLGAGGSAPARHGAAHDAALHDAALHSGAVEGSVADPLAAAHRRCLATVRSARLPVLPSLFQGLSGMGLVLADLASLSGSAALRQAAVRSGRSLFAYAIPRGGGIRFLGPGNRFSPDLADGAAGVLLFLAQLRDRRPNALFTLDPDQDHDHDAARDAGGHPPAWPGVAQLVAATPGTALRRTP
jgi:tRNA A-37 threonylcarbamoyl transferase component Bud32